MAQSITNPHIQRRHSVRSNDRDNNEKSVSEAKRYDRFGGLNFGAAFFGWIVASGIGVLLTALLAAIGSAVAVTKLSDNAQNIANSVDKSNATAIGLVSGALLLLAMAISYYAGGYVAGRMSRYDGARQGTGVWAIGILVMLLLGGLGAAFGAKYNLIQSLNLPHLPINQGSFTRGGLITTILILATTLLAAITGGKVGEDYHHKVDETGVK